VQVDLADLVIQFDQDVMSIAGRAAIDDECWADAGLAAGFVDMTAEDEGGFRAFDEIAHGPAAGPHAVVCAIDAVEGGSVGDQDEVTRAVGLGEAAFEAPGDFGFGDFVGCADGDGGGGATDEGDLIDLAGEAVDGDVELFEGLVDGRGVHVTGYGEDRGREGLPGGDGAMGVGGCAIGGDVTGDDDHVDRTDSLEHAGDSVKAVVDIGEGDQFHGK
jgi:hypothetical protein